MRFSSAGCVRQPIRFNLLLEILSDHNQIHIHIWTAQISRASNVYHPFTNPHAFLNTRKHPLYEVWCYVSCNVNALFLTLSELKLLFVRIFVARCLCLNLIGAPHASTSFRVVDLYGIYVRTFVYLSENEFYVCCECEEYVDVRR